MWGIMSVARDNYTGTINIFIVYRRLFFLFFLFAVLDYDKYINDTWTGLNFAELYHLVNDGTTYAWQFNSWHTL